MSHMRRSWQSQTVVSLGISNSMGNTVALEEITMRLDTDFVRYWSGRYLNEELARRFGAGV
jgi:hypothetical protein